MHVCPIQEFAVTEPYDVIISGLPLPEAGIKELAGALKKKCGCDGTVKAVNAKSGDSVAADEVLIEFA